MIGGRIRGLTGPAGLVLVALVFVGCSTTPRPSSGLGVARSAAVGAVAALDGRPSTATAPRPTKASGPPSWLTHYPTSTRYFVGVGGAADTGNPASDIANAQKTARNALASEIATTIKSQTSLETRANGKGDTQRSVALLIDERVNLTLNGVQLVDSYHSKKWGYWYYYRLPRSSLDPRPKIEGAVGKLLDHLERPISLSLGPIAYSNTGLSSAFSLYLQDQVLLAIRHNKGIRVSAQPQGAAAVKPSAGGKKKASRGLAVRTGLGPTYLLSGTFFGSTGREVSVFLRLTDTANQSVVASSSFTLDPSMLPRSLSIAPVNYATAVAAKAAVASVGASSNGALRVRLSPVRGDGATYFDGEDLVLDVSANRNCYIKLYHIDVHGKVSLILPNRFSRNNYLEAGKVYRIPASGAAYRFQLGKPYGVEFIKLVASTRQFADMEQAFTDLGAATRDLLTRGLTVEGSGPEERAQAMVSYTILAKGR